MGVQFLAKYDLAKKNKNLAKYIATFSNIGGCLRHCPLDSNYLTEHLVQHDKAWKMSFTKRYTTLLL